MINRKVLLRIVLPIFVLSVIAFSILAYIIVSDRSLAFDEAVLTAINARANSGLDRFFVLFTELASSIVIAAATLILTVYFVIKKKYKKAAFIALVIGGSALVTYLLKLLFERLRPDLWEWIITETQFSFPSGHATASAAIAIVIVLLFWRTKWRFIAMLLSGIYVLLIGISRMYLGVHYPTDILGGWLVALGWSALVILMLYSFSKKRWIPSKESS